MIPCGLLCSVKRCSSIMEQVHRLNKIGSAVSHVEQGSSCLPCGEDPGGADVPKKCVSCRWEQRGDGWYPLLLLAPLCLFPVCLCWKWSQVARAGTSSTTRQISRGEKLWQHGSVGGRWRDCASLWVENEAKCEVSQNKILGSFV